ERNPSDEREHERRQRATGRQTMRPAKGTDQDGTLPNEGDESGSRQNAHESGRRGIRRGPEGAGERVRGRSDDPAGDVQQRGEAPDATDREREGEEPPHDGRNVGRLLRKRHELAAAGQELADGLGPQPGDDETRQGNEEGEEVGGTDVRVRSEPLEEELRVKTRPHPGLAEGT